MALPVPSGPAALLLSAAQLAILSGSGNQRAWRGVRGSWADAASTQPQSLSSSTSSQTLPNTTGSDVGSAYQVQFDVVSEEDHADELEITDHPVEQGAAVTDNAYKKPSMVVVHCGFTMSGNTGPNASESRTSGAMQRLYALMLKIQVERTPVTVYTGKRTYQNMLLKSIATRSDESSEYSLPLTLVWREIIIVQTAAVNVTTTQTVQAQPENTTPTVQAGAKQLAPAPLFVPFTSAIAGAPQP